MKLDVEVAFPELHADQIRASEVPAKYKAIRCGRRWGKTILGETEGSDTAVQGLPVGWFAPSYKMVSETFDQLVEILGPLVVQKTKQGGVIKLATKGRIDFWSLDNPDAGRSRRYAKVIIDEGAFAGPAMMDIWMKSIKPTLLDYDGEAIVLSNTSGNDPDNFFWRICNEPEHGFVEFHAPTRNNPLLPLRKAGESEADHMIRRQSVIDDLAANNPPLVFAQEYEAQFVDWSGNAFFEEGKLLVPLPDGSSIPAPYPQSCGTVFATIDTATKTGKDRDGTAVVFWAYTPKGQGLFELVILDWDIVQIEGVVLTQWLPGIFERLEALARETGARSIAGAHIEDKSSGMVLLQHARNQKWAAYAIDSKLTAVGKSERAISVSRYVYQNRVKFSEHAYHKVVVYKGASRNHLREQVLKFRVGDKDLNTSDDLLDCFCYGIAIALGNDEGF